MTWDARGYDQRFSFVTTHGQALVTALAPQPGEHIVDLGCGTGHLTAEIAQAGALMEGLDADDEMLRVARSRHPGIAFRRADARTFTVAEPVDAVFSNATLHWVPDSDQQAVLEHVRTCLRPSGGFVAEMGGAGNVATVVSAVEQARARFSLPPLTSPPWCFPTPQEQTTRLEGAGFRVHSIDHFDRPTPLSPGDTAASWLRMFGRHLTTDVPEPDRSGFDAEIDRVCAPDLRGDDGQWQVDYVRLRWYATARSARG
jgi:SAM-dependent methyltransferase